MFQVDLLLSVCKAWRNDSESHTKSGWTLRISIFNHFPGDANTTGPVMTLRTTDLHKGRASTEIETALFETLNSILRASSHRKPRCQPENWQSSSSTTKDVKTKPREDALKGQRCSLVRMHTPDG